MRVNKLCLHTTLTLMTIANSIDTFSLDLISLPDSRISTFGRHGRAKPNHYSRGIDNTITIVKNASIMKITCPGNKGVY